MTFLEKIINGQEKTELTGAKILEYFDESILSKYDCIKGATEREKKMFLMGLHIGSEGYAYIHLKCYDGSRPNYVSGTPTSYSVQEAIANNFNNAKTPNAKDFKKEIKQILR